MASLFEEMGGTYTLGADGMYYPNLKLPEEEMPRYGKYGRMRHAYLREYKKAHPLNETDDTNTQAELISKLMITSQRTIETCKAQDSIVWAAAANNIRNVAEEIIINELIDCSVRMWHILKYYAFFLFISRLFPPASPCNYATMKLGNTDRQMQKSCPNRQDFCAREKEGDMVRIRKKCIV